MPINRLANEIPSILISFSSKQAMDGKNHNGQTFAVAACDLQIVYKLLRLFMSLATLQSVPSDVIDFHYFLMTQRDITAVTSRRKRDVIKQNLYDSRAIFYDPSVHWFFFLSFVNERHTFSSAEHDPTNRFVFYGHCCSFSNNLVKAGAESSIDDTLSLKCEHFGVNKFDAIALELRIICGFRERSQKSHVLKRKVEKSEYKKNWPRKPKKIKSNQRAPEKRILQRFIQRMHWLKNRFSRSSHMWALPWVSCMKCEKYLPV